MPTTPAEAASMGATVPSATAVAEGTVFDVAVIGAGPAGLAAAVAAVAGGARVALVDGAPRAGGQYWRHRPADDGALHHDWSTFRRLRDGVEAASGAGRLSHLAGHAVWHLERIGEAFVIHATADDRDVEILAGRVILATGAYDRQVPFPGWTLPGVFTAGGAQALLKGQGVLAGQRIVVAGTGPLLLPLAAGLATAGAKVAGVFEAGRPTAFLRHPMTAARAGKAGEGIEYLRTFARHRIAYKLGRAVIAAHGTDAVEAVTVARLDADWRVIEGSQERIACDAVAVGYGFTPQVELAVDLGCELVLDTDGSVVAEVDDAQRSTVDGAWIAGEACGVGGSALALAEGELAGLHAAASVTGRAPDAGVLAALARRRRRLRDFATLLAETFPVRPGWQSWLADDTLACRCEEVPVAAVRAAVTDLGATDARSAKLFARAGMGLCQGRVCGSAMAGIVATACGRDVTADDLVATVRRPIATPITLGALAAGPGAASVAAGPVAAGAASLTPPSPVTPPVPEVPA